MNDPRKKFFFLRIKKDTDSNPVPQLGAGILSRILRSNGHETAALDQLLLLDRKPMDPIETIMRFNPDAVGMTLFTSTVKESIKIAEELRAKTKIPLIAGGPHATLYSSELAEKGVFDCIVVGEAETVICDVVQNAARQKQTEIINAPRPVLSDVPAPDFSGFYNYSSIKVYPLQTSRGCPYQCRFCAVRQIAAQKWRKRDPAACVEELKQAKIDLPNLKTVQIVDDAPTTDRERFKEFLRMCVSENINLSMVIDNMRADSVDAELVNLAKKAGCGSLCIAVEHADPDVFSFVNKGETLEEIRAAAGIIKNGGLKLGMCFIIGLPYDSFEKTMTSVKFAVDTKADFIFWNMAHPMKGTFLREWFENNGGTLYPDENYKSFDTKSLKIPDPVVETPDFSMDERKRSYFVAAVITGQFPLRFIEAFYLFYYGARHRFLFPAIAALAKKAVNPDEIMYSIKAAAKRALRFFR